MFVSHYNMNVNFHHLLSFEMNVKSQLSAWLNITEQGFGFKSKMVS